MNSRNKGACAEREVAGVLREEGWPDAVRGQQRSGLEQADVVGLPGWHLEVKRVERLQLWAAWAQAVRDSKPGEQPMVVTRRSHQPWLAVVDFRVLLRILAEQELLS